MSAVLRGNVRMALSGVRGSKWRSFLTMLGIIVGIVAVVAVVGIGEGVKRQISGTMQQFGDDLLIVRPPQASAGINSNDVLFGMNSALSLTHVDTEVVRGNPDVGLSTPLGVVPGSVAVEDRAVPTMQVLSAGADLPDLLKQDVEYGDFWQSRDEDAQFAVLGRWAALKLFDEPVPLGRTFSFRGHDFQVRGVFAAFPHVPLSPTAQFDDAIFIPYKTAARLTNNAAGPYAVLAKPASPERLGSAKRSIEKQLLAAHGGEHDFAVLGAQESLESGNGVIRLLTTWIMAVGAISLLMGGIGIMNVMLLVVTERMHEIGVRKAVGATSRQILGQFVLEATVLSLLGGIIGIAVSAAAIGLLRVYTDLDPVISWQAVGIAAVVSVLLGIIFGTIPAVKAARKDPIEALRHE